MDAFSLLNPLPWLVIVGVCLLVGYDLAARSRFYGARLAEESRNRHGTVDGLRGFLALAVFGAHAVNMYGLHALARWDTPGPSFYGSAAEAGVSLFFMITAFLFWTRVLRSGSSFDARGFLEGRVRRILPMYLASVVLAVMVVLSASETFLPGGAMAFARELRAWFSFGFLDMGDLNGLPRARSVNAVYWTLAYEWMFYLLLPLLALYARGWKALALVAVVAIFGKQSPIVLNFLFGALGAELMHRGWLRGWFASPKVSVIPLAFLAAALYGPWTTVYGVVPEALLFVFFLFVLDGNSLFGLLRTRAARFLGMVSYSIYLIHCVLLYAIVHAINAAAGVEHLDATQYWTLAATAAVGTVLLSALTYRYIEYPFIARKPVALPAHPVPASAFTGAAENGLVTIPSQPMTRMPTP